MNFRLARPYNLNANSTISNASAVKAGKKSAHQMVKEAGWENRFHFTVVILSSPNSTHSLESDVDSMGYKLTKMAPER